MPNSRTPSVHSLEKAFTVLEILAESRKGLTLAQITQRSGLPKSSVHCLLLTLERSAYLQRNEISGRYLFGTKLFRLASRSVGELELREQSMPFLVPLARETGLTVHLAIQERATAVVIEKVDPPGLIRLATWPGKQMDLHTTGVGKSLLAYMPKEEFNKFARGYGLPRHNGNALSTVRQLSEELAEIRKRGYSFDDEEDEIGLRCIGVPVFDRSCECIAAISIAGTTSHIRLDNVETLARKARQTADAISSQMGFVEGSPATEQ